VQLVTKCADKGSVGASWFFEVEGVVDFEFEAEVLLVGEPVEEVFDEARDVVVGEEGHPFQLELSPVPGHMLQHEGVDDVDDVSDGLPLHPGMLDVLLRPRGVVLLLFLFMFVVLVVEVLLLVDGPGQHHEEGEEDVEVVGLVEALVDFGQELAEHVGAGLFVELLGLVVLGLLLLRVEVDVDFVEVTLHVNLFEDAVVLPLFGVCYEIAESVDAIGGNIFCVAIAVVHFFLN